MHVPPIISALRSISAVLTPLWPSSVASVFPPLPPPVSDVAITGSRRRFGQCLMRYPGAQGTNGPLSVLEALYTDIHAHPELSMHADNGCGRGSTLRFRL